jgi:2-hydroxychromene-2-carboxylate isomerase
MSLSFDFYFSFRSPYSYFGLIRVLKVSHAYDVEIVFRPVYPLAIRTPDFFKRVDPRYRPYQMLDCQRVAAYYRIPYRRPIPDPIVQDLATYVVAPEQPYIFRLTRLAMAATMAGRGLDFAEQVACLLWDGTVDGWDQGNSLRNAVARAGLDFDVLEKAVAADPAKYDMAIEENQKAHAAAGHWGVPLFVFQGEPFFGQDRIDMLVWRMKQKGLGPRARRRA